MNALNIDLTWKVVILRPGALVDGIVPAGALRAGLSARELPFLCLDGFGCAPFTAGSNIGGVWLRDCLSRGVIAGPDVEAIIDEAALTDHERALLTVERTARR